MSVNQTYWSIVSMMVMMIGSLILIGCIYSYPGSLFWAEGWIWAGTVLFGLGGFSTIVAPAVVR